LVEFDLLSRADLYHNHDIDIGNRVGSDTVIKELLKEAHLIIQGALGPSRLQGSDNIPVFYSGHLGGSIMAGIGLAVALAGYRDGHRFWLVPIPPGYITAEAAMRSQFRPQFEGAHRYSPQLWCVSHC